MRLHDHSNAYKGNISLGLAYRFRGSVHYHHGGKHGSIQADMMLEKELRVVHLDWQTEKERDRDDRDRQSRGGKKVDR